MEHLKYSLCERYSDDTDRKLIPRAGERGEEYVYVIINPLTKLTKIGITKNPFDRISSLSCASGCNLEPIFLLELKIGVDENMKYIERYLHDYFQGRRLIGEWFQLGVKDLIEIRNLFYEIDGHDFQNHLQRILSRVKIPLS